jgi:hypothetical protein
VCVCVPPPRQWIDFLLNCHYFKGITYYLMNVCVLMNGTFSYYPVCV